MNDLHACIECGRHVRATEAACPFCGAAIDARPRMRKSARLSRAAVFAGAALLGMACGGSEGDSTDDSVENTGGGEDTDDGSDESDGDNDEQMVMPYGAPPRRDRLV